jgi:hypothetical protein
MGEIETYVKAMADADRLKIISLLAVQPRSTLELASLLELRPPQAARHLQQLAETGVVQESGGKWKLDEKALAALAQRNLSGLERRATSEDFEGDDEERKVLASFCLPDGRLKSIPMQQKKLLVVLRHVVQGFEIGVKYPEREVNSLLKRYHEDTAALRRYLVDSGLMQRQQGIYWRE